MLFRLFYKEDEKRAQDIAALFIAEQMFFGSPLTHRKAWGELPEELTREWVKEAEKAIEEPDVIITEEVARRYTTLGDRKVCDEEYSKSTHRIRMFALAECVENQGRFLSAYEKAVHARCDFNTWVLTAHDHEMENYYGRNVTIDLGSAVFSWELLHADYLLGDNVSKATRKRIYENVLWRTIEPFEEMLEGKKEMAWWFATTNNWNAVCLSTVMGSALAMPLPRQRQARFVAAWERYIQNFLHGFTEDGYCTEGLSYWSYGFSNYIFGAEIIRRMTGGAMDAFEDEKVRTIALFPQRMDLFGGSYPSIADCVIGYLPDVHPVNYCNARLGQEKLPLPIQISPLHSDLMLWFDEFSKAPTYPAPLVDEEYLRRSYFPQAGVLLCRSGKEGDGLSVSLKGGHNHEHHNHNDLGSFVVANHGVQLLADIGHTQYTGKTFGAERYHSPFYSSYGHSVPFPAGLEQKPLVNTEFAENTYRATVITEKFTDDGDIFALDLTTVYDPKRIPKLQREFHYRRTEDTSLTVTDTVEFAQRETYAFSLMTYGAVEMQGEKLIISHGGELLHITFESPSPLTITTEALTGDIRYGASPLYQDRCPVRILITLDQPLTNAKIITHITP